MVFWCIKELVLTALKICFVSIMIISNQYRNILTQNIKKHIPHSVAIFLLWLCFVFYLNQCACTLHCTIMPPKCVRTNKIKHYHVGSSKHINLTKPSRVFHHKHCFFQCSDRLNKPTISPSGSTLIEWYVLLLSGEIACASNMLFAAMW